MVVFSWSFPKTISMCHTRPRHCYNEDKTNVPVLFLINFFLFFILAECYFLSTCDDPFLLLLLGSICNLLLTFPTITSIGLPGDMIEGWSSLVISSFSFFFFFNEWSFFVKEHDLCTWFVHIKVPHSHGMWFLTC